jgi:MGT family glycosyltransferase
MGHVLSHVGRTLLIAKELRGRGHRVLFAGQGHYLEIVRKEKFDVLNLDGLEGKRLLAKGRRAMVGLQFLTADMFDGFVQGELKLLREVKPDAVLCDLQPTMAISASIAGIPCINIVNAYLTPYAVPPLDHFIFHPLFRWFLEPLRRWVAGKPFRKLSLKYALPSNIVFRDLLSLGDLVIIPDVPEFAPTRNLPGHFHYSGPLVWEPKNGSIAGLAGINPERTTIYFTLGSTGLQEMFHRVIQDLRDTDYQVILTTGGQVQPDDLGVLPDNFFVDSFFPVSTFLQHCQVVICHGGNGTLYQALGSGIPVIAIPTHTDQKANAYFLEQQGAGLAINPKQLDKLIPSISRILSEPSFKENALRLESILTSSNGPKNAAILIEELLAK